MPKGSIKIEGLPGIELTQKQILFCEEYCRNGWNASKAALFAGYSEDTAPFTGAENLKKQQIKDYIAKVKDDHEYLLGINKNWVIDKHVELAQSSIAHLHNTWIKRKEFDQLTDRQKACIAEISTQTRKIFDKGAGFPVETEFVRIKLYDKQKALDSIAKLMGYDAPVKLDVNANVDVQMYLPENGRETADK